MKEITNLMIREYNIKKLGYDFMGFNIRRNTLSFHHLIIPKRDCNRLRIENSGYVRWNGAILSQETSHEYLHKIEIYDRQAFDEITQLMIEENKMGKLDTEILLEIHNILEKFENKHKNERTSRGKVLIRPEYITTRNPLNRHKK